MCVVVEGWRDAELLVLVSGEKPKGKEAPSCVCGGLLDGWGRIGQMTAGAEEPLAAARIAGRQ